MSVYEDIKEGLLERIAEGAKMSAVKLGFLLHYHDTKTLNAASMILFDEIFKQLDRIEPVEELISFWVKVPRGSIEDYGFENDAEAFEYFNVKNKAELDKAFNDFYPDEYYWYRIQASKYKNNRALLVRHFMISIQPDVCEPVIDLMLYDRTELLSWVLYAIKEVIHECEQGTYNDRVQAELPYSKRYGVIPKKVLWDHRPEYRENGLEKLTKEDIEQFIEVISNEEKAPTGRIKEMTFNKYFEYALPCFKNAGLPVDGATPFQAFMAHGEDFGLCCFRDIDLDSPQEFERCLKNRSGGGHPWGLRYGSSRSRIMLYPRLDENGYYFTYSGNPNWNAYELVKMYLPLKEAGLPVVFLCPEETILYLREEEMVGFVPDDKTPVYCQECFREDIEDFYHFDPEKDAPIKDLVKWYSVRPLKLKEVG